MRSSRTKSASDSFVVRALAPTDWPAIEFLFGERGGCGGCWCMAWRLPRIESTWAAHKGEPNPVALKALVESGVARACVAFAGDAPVGWCSLGRSQISRRPRAAAYSMCPDSRGRRPD
jgi:hypothetical protein